MVIYFFLDFIVTTKGQRWVTVKIENWKKEGKVGFNGYRVRYEEYTVIMNENFTSDTRKSDGKGINFYIDSMKRSVIFKETGKRLHCRYYHRSNYFNNILLVFVLSE